MKHLLPTSILVALLVIFISCSKSDNSGSGTNISPLEKEYKALTSDNVNSFFLESSLATKGCAGSNCSASFKFNFKNLSYVTDISKNIGGSPSPISIWSLYTSEKETVTSIWRDYSANQYRLRYTLKDGRVLITAWVTY